MLRKIISGGQTGADRVRLVSRSRQAWNMGDMFELMLHSCFLYRAQATNWGALVFGGPSVLATRRLKPALCLLFNEAR
jgi:hypothetical protein